MSDRITAWLRLAACPEGSREHRVSKLIHQVGVSGVAERCGVTTREVLVWIQLRQVPEEFDAALEDDPNLRRPVDSLVPKYVELHAQGMRVGEIATLLGVSKQAVSKALKSNQAG